MKRLVSLVLAAAALAAVAAASASANHSWGGYHWARTANPFTLKLGDNVSSNWDGSLATASSDWSKSAVLDTTVVAGSSKNKNCRPRAGRVEVCSGSYGQNGWLGLAQIWLQGGHIVQGAVKVNDTYFSMPQYNFTTEKLHVMCQETGHTLGLDHQDESGISLNTCMDYYRNTSNSDTKSTHPNAHDYDQLALIYQHLDATTTVGGAALSLGSPARTSKFVAQLGAGSRLVTYITWTGF
jgi:hypothetical protein